MSGHRLQQWHIYFVCLFIDLPKTVHINQHVGFHFSANGPELVSSANFHLQSLRRLLKRDPLLIQDMTEHTRQKQYKPIQDSAAPACTVAQHNKRK